MEYRHLGASGFKVPVLSFGTGTFAGTDPFFATWGNSDVDQARRLIDICLEAGVTLFDSADVYSGGAAESVLGAAIKGRRDQVLLSTKAGFRFDRAAANSVGSSRFHLVRAVEAALTAWAPTTSTCSSCTASTRTRRWRKPCPRSTTWCAPARSATWACPTSPAGS
ncbi:hypothetical protein NB717_003320 [Xanthomonas sacchari]|nr:hypothetical protein [Xanthomonas sacchari]